MPVRIKEIVCGIYQIVNLVSGKIYVGSSVNCYLRWYQHQVDLNKGKHHSKHMNFAWKKYGASAFEFRIVEVVAPVAALLDREKFWIESTRCYDQSVGYNTFRVPNSPLGTRHSAATKAKISAIQKGKKINAEARANMSAAKKGKKNSLQHALNIGLSRMIFTGEKLQELLNLRANGWSSLKLAKHFSCSKTVVLRTLKGQHLNAPNVTDPLPQTEWKNGKFVPGQACHNRAAREVEFEILRRVTSGEKQKDIARIFGMHETSIPRLLKRVRAEMTQC